MQMETIFLMISLWTFFGTHKASSGDLADIDCLKSIKHSFEDPRNHLNSSWNFNNNTNDFVCYFVGVDCWTSADNKVLNIKLANMGLRGRFPQGIENCTFITGLNLSGNELSGSIPSDISHRLPFVSTLDLSNNNLSGEIPETIANCSYLNVLKLDNNQLIGQIPATISLLNRLRSFSVTNNFLSGPVPLFNSDIFGADSYANNPGLCGGPLEPCSSPEKSHASFTIGFMVGYVIAMVLVLIFGIWFCMPKQPAKRKVTKNKKEKGRRIPIVDGRSRNINISILERLVTRMSFKELSEATSAFSTENVIGLGIMGIMYKATLANGWFLAVKRLHHSQHFQRQFVSELMTLGRLRHRNLVPLLGFCMEKQERLLVYKYMSNGALYDWLHGPASDAKIIDWPLRVKIIVGLARGLAWLHYCSNIRVAHLNISSKFILLDQKFEPKISNFGGALFMNSYDTQSTKDFIVNGEFWEMGFVKKDVHSFGMILLELITGKDPSKVTNLCHQFGKSPNEWITHVSNSSSGYYENIEKCLVGKGYDGEIFQVLRIACNCAQPSPEQRPTMLEVYGTLSAVRESYGLTDDSDILSQTEILMPTS